ncbi:MAG TPA: hypothetical protein VG308_05920, partial [Stellaceae bacterium]|nr:hypothetical protein [Stellaceae bacterium]
MGEQAMTLAALFLDVARRLPHRPAVDDGRNAWSYRELAERAPRIAGGSGRAASRPATGCCGRWKTAANSSSCCSAVGGRAVRGAGQRPAKKT